VAAALKGTAEAFSAIQEARRATGQQPLRDLQKTNLQQLEQEKKANTILERIDQKIGNVMPQVAGF
jgi:hypothetical protein